MLCVVLFGLCIVAVVVVLNRQNKMAQDETWQIIRELPIYDLNLC